MFMRRSGFRWEALTKLYVPKSPPVTPERPPKPPEPPEKVALVLNALIQPDADLKTVASELGYEDHHALAEYMRSEGYMWEPEIQNYGYSGTKPEGAVMLEEVVNENNFKEDTSQVMEEIRKLLPYLKALTDNQAQNQTEKTVPILPHYRIPGIAVTKSVRIVYPLVDLAEHFCSSLGMSQREFFELALIETLQRYGDVEAVSAILV